MNVLRILRHPRAAVVAHDLVMVIVAWIAAGWVVGRGQSPGFAGSLPLFAEALLILAAQGLVLWSTGLYKGLWRFASFPDLWNIVRASAFGTILIISVLTIFYGAGVREVLPAALVYPGVLFLALGLPRMVYRFWKDGRRPDMGKTTGLKRTLILGAGRSGALLERELRHRGASDVIGFLDDDQRLRDAQVHGVPVLGTIDELPRVSREVGADMAIIAMPSANNQQMQRIVGICEKSDVEFRTLPTLNDLGNKATRIDDLKRVVIDDLLGREPVKLVWDSIREGLSGKRVMITGGGGSIGSELCRQIARLNPVELIVVDNSEYALYRIDLELRNNFQDLVFCSVLGDICDPATVEKVVGDFKPDMIFHAAAYKHLPILQTQIREAFRNNVLGTKGLAEAAAPVQGAALSSGAAVGVHPVHAVLRHQPDQALGEFLNGLVEGLAGTVTMLAQSVVLSFHYAGKRTDQNPALTCQVAVDFVLEGGWEQVTRPNGDTQCNTAVMSPARSILLNGKAGINPGTGEKVSPE